MIFTVIVIPISATFAPVLKAYAKADELAEFNALLENVANQMIDDLSNAAKMDETATVNAIAFWVAANMLNMP